MVKIISKLAFLMMILILNVGFLVGVPKTYAYFSDTEISEENLFKAGTLSFSLSDQFDFSPNFTSQTQAQRQIQVIREGTLDFQYSAKTDNLVGALCEIVKIEARLGEEVKYLGNLSEFLLEESILYEDELDNNWIFIMEIDSGGEIMIGSCQFEFIFEAWQTNIESYEDGGFSDQKRALTHLTLRDEALPGENEGEIVLNEILPNPLGNECQLESIEGEWVELYNQGGAPVDLAGWYLEDDSSKGNRVWISSENTHRKTTIIGANGSSEEWLVVFLNGCILNNTGGDAVYLYNQEGDLIDAYSYSGSVPENKSSARIPDGTGDWVDPVPTPGGPNLLEKLTQNNEDSGDDECGEEIKKSQEESQSPKNSENGESINDIEDIEMEDIEMEDIENDIENKEDRENEQETKTQDSIKSDDKKDEASPECVECEKNSEEKEVLDETEKNSNIDENKKEGASFSESENKNIDQNLNKNEEIGAEDYLKKEAIFLKDSGDKKSNQQNENEANP